MGYRNKEECLREAQRLGIDTAGMSWPQLQKVVSSALKTEEIMTKIPTGFPLRESHEAIGDSGNTIEDYRDYQINIAPEMAQDHKRTIEYVEELGDDFEVEEKSYDLGEAQLDIAQPIASTTFRIKGQSGNRVRANSALPRENAGIVFRPGMDLVPVVTFQGRSGYLWTHHRLPNVKALLKEAGAYEKYKDQFKEEPNIWYSTGLLVCDPSVVHHIFNEIHKDWMLRKNGWR